MLRALVVAAFLLPALSFAASGPSLSDWHVIPAAAHTEGAQGTFWRTDISITNPHTWRGINVFVMLLRTGEDGTRAEEVGFSLASTETLVLEDVVNTVFEHVGTGAVLVYTKSDAAFVTSARTYTGADATFGQTEAGQSETHGGPGTAYTTGIQQSDRFRTNLGVANASPIALSLRARVHDATGTQCGQHIFTVAPWSHDQVAMWTFCDSLESGYVRWDAVSQGPDMRWVAYASVIDNASGDAVFLEEKVDLEFTAQQPYNNVTGWWAGTFVRPTDAIVYDVYFEQKAAKVEGWMYNQDGFLEMTMAGVESQGQMSNLTGSFHYLPCLDETIETGNASVSATRISGNLRVAGPCFAGTISFELSRQQ